VTGPTTRIGVVGGALGAVVDERGKLTPDRALWHLEWWVGADDRWHLPSREAAVRQALVDGMPVVRTAMRVPGGDAVHHAYGAGPLAAVEVANDSPTPFVAALVVEGASHLAVFASTIVVNGRPTVATGRPPSRWAVGTDASTERVVASGGATDGPFVPRSDRGARLSAAFLYPVAHRTTLRAAVALAPRDDLGPGDAARLPAPGDAARGWRAQLERGMRTDLPDPELQGAIDSARADLLLAGQAWLPDPAVVGALHDWGFVAEAAEARKRLRRRDRRRLDRRAVLPREEATGCLLGAAGPAFLAGVRATLVQEEGANVRLLPALPDEWRGFPLDVRAAPTGPGPVSWSVRWHGERAALLWEAPPGTVLTAPRLDPDWSTNEAAGEALLG
jgi:hypothetical protein